MSTKINVALTVNVLLVVFVASLDLTDTQLVINVRNQASTTAPRTVPTSTATRKMPNLVRMLYPVDIPSSPEMETISILDSSEEEELFIKDMQSEILGIPLKDLNLGGDVVQENISANVTEDTIMLEFQRSDGTLVTQLIDFRNEVQILKSLILGEEERGQSQYQVMCFIFHFPKDSFISSDAMSKLRQKNPSTIRTPEEDRGRTNRTMDYVVILKHAAIISPHVREMCTEAGQATYTRYKDVVEWATIQGIPPSSYEVALKRFPTTPDYLSNDVVAEAPPPASIANCADIKNMWQPCQCRLELCIGWYPCGLKYCKGKGQTKNSVMSYRCGIKTCRSCHLFAYYVGQKQQCLWDE